MRRLAPADSLFVSLETSKLPMRVGGLVTLDTTGAPDFGFDRVRELYAGRIARVPKLTWKLKEAPLRLDRPLWTDGGEIDIDRHLQRVSVPAPGGPREVAEVVGRLFGEPLDRDLPLWRMWYLDGVAEGTAALFSTHHHCLMDGTSGANVSSVMFDLEPNPQPDRPCPPEGPGGKSPSDLEQVLRSGLGLLATPVRLPGFVGAYTKRVTRMIPDVLKRGVPSALLSPAPRTSFNRLVGDRRVLAFASLSLDDLKAVRKRLDVTVNDVIVAVCTDALERYLRRIGEPVPDRPLTVAVPVSTRPPGNEEITNQVSFFPISVPTKTTGPVEHVHAIARETERGKQLAATFAASRLPSFGELMSPLLWSAAVRAVTPFFPYAPVVMNTMVSTVRGAPIPLYVAGARVTGIYPTSIVLVNMGINFTAISSDAQVDIGITVDPEQVPDPWLVADGLIEALADLMRAAGLDAPRPIAAFGAG
jgi:WS/DGAT/MGAT family acyltransferase